MPGTGAKTDQRPSSMTLLRKLDSYVFRQTLAPFFLGLGVFTFILMMDALFDVAATIIQRDVPAAIVFELLALSLPYILVLTIPMAFLYGLLIAIGRLSADSELIAMRSSGISLFYLYRPLLVLSMLLAGVTFYMVTKVMPWSNTRQIELTSSIQATSLAAGELRPRVFHEQIEGPHPLLLRPRPGRTLAGCLRRRCPATHPERDRRGRRRLPPPDTTKTTSRFWSSRTLSSRAFRSLSPRKNRRSPSPDGPLVA